MEAIYHGVDILSRFWVCMLLLIFFFGGAVPARQDRSSQLLIMATLACVLPVVQASGKGQLGYAEFTWGFPVISLLGFVLFFLGILLNWTGILTLNKQWRAVVYVPADHKLVETGVYRVIRHPIYAGLLLQLLGLGLALSNWVSLLLILLPNAASLTYRIFVEERALEGALGRDYLDYERRTKRLIPGIF
jgi:protein-S-isoprenylcysteine O-methyltransferase Ste14